MESVQQTGSAAGDEKHSSSTIYLQSPPNSAAALQKSTPESTAKINSLLQQNHDNFHIFSDFEDRLHNHLSHHLLAIYALGATPENLQFAYDTNAGHLLPIGEKNAPVVENLSHSESWGEYLGKAEMYHTFLQFFQNSIDQVGWQETVKRHIFSEKGVKDGMPERLVAGFLHPWIHLGYGIEFEQPAIIAEGLAQTAVHDMWPAVYLQRCQSEAVASHTSPENATMKSLFQEAYGSTKLRESTKWSDPQKNKAVYANALDEMVALAAKWYIPPTADDETIKQAAAELAAAAAYICATTPRTDKKVKFDFFLMHCVTSSVFLDVWVRQAWIGNAEKALLLNYFGWMVLNMYVSRGCAEINLNQVRTYFPKGSHGVEWLGKWEDIAERAVVLKDDGHVAKTVRALMNAAEATAPYARRPGFELRTPLFLKIAEMAVDAAEDCGEGEPLWVRSTGHPEAWENVSGPRLVYD
ncbi:hypothetical protein DRE_00422 [Drechslerella stenobrocha 248]|uniref:Oxidoreductase AflY n=1 Tax=Drechslerella stenobrocha 248 TaxID=1043628 RepID=W7HVB7_9PEZI|nr:hypothetical protein DRE_00422 [Drechslerella stenobrocha 248]